MYDPNAHDDSHHGELERTKITEPTPSYRPADNWSPRQVYQPWQAYNQEYKEYYNAPTVGARPSPPQPHNDRVLRSILLTLLCATAFGAMLFGAGWTFGRNSVGTGIPSVQPIAVTSMSEARLKVVSRIQPSMVQINTQQETSNSVGSGVIVDQRGYIVTNNHVISNAQNIRVQLPNGHQTAGQLVGANADYDLAIIKVTTSTPLTPATLGDSSGLQVGQDVLAIGSPLGISKTVTSGIISAVGRTISEGHGVTLHSAIQTDAPINPGNSGGALVDMQGNLVGIPTLTAINPEFNTPANGMGFAIPSNKVKEVMDQYIR
ncbi:hypothetical protein KSD_84730 [Ktedonobacter sp. SOSP1-85]|uniref:S1C family serine protease n=1 Tax=Ktedonobacter sp. SOSP1-85 TaxID=2778367 RepID=UPI0019152FCB|nr:trypsin-like peptidase domain-containing protein [Ktedonobacter sp. SOSP1-85]GHO80702.1 hypothetical protein KSD_84730 [Ktedonobacter sp. SOSP1-85]